MKPCPSKVWGPAVTAGIENPPPARHTRVRVGGRAWVVSKLVTIPTY